MTAPFNQSYKHRRLAPFGPAWDGAGVRGFSNEGYWYHPLVPGLSFDGSTFVAKTVTTYPNEGNTPLDAHFRPAMLFPRSIVPYLRKGMVLNAVGLSNPGVRMFLKDARWFSITKPFLISYMPILDESDVREHCEVDDFVADVRQAVRERRFATVHLGIQLNVSCPNVGADLEGVTKKARNLLSKLSLVNVPIVVKLNLLVSPEAAAEIAKHPACTGLCISNSVPFGELIPSEWWDAQFPDGSPLMKLKMPSGGLSGKPLLPFVEAWLRKFREIDSTTYVNAGGGVLHPDHVNRLHDAGANSIFVSSAAVVRPWRVQKIIDRAHKIF